MNRRVGWSAVFLVLLSALAFGTLRDPGDRTQADRVRSISETIRCPQCTGQSVAESDASIARTMRAEVAERVAGGQSDEEIVDYFVGRYGSDVSLQPEASGVAGVIWILPMLVLGLGLAGVLAATGVGGRLSASASDADHELVDDLLSERAEPRSGPGERSKHG